MYFLFGADAGAFQFIASLDGSALRYQPKVLRLSPGPSLTGSAPHHKLDVNSQNIIPLCRINPNRYTPEGWDAGQGAHILASPIQPGRKGSGPAIRIGNPSISAFGLAAEGTLFLLHLHEIEP